MRPALVLPLFLLGFLAAACASDAERAREAMRQGRLETAIRLDPQLVTAHARLAGVRYRQGRNLDAIAAAQRALALRDAAWLHELTGRAWVREREWASAVTSFHSALESEPRRTWLHFEIGRAHEAARDRDAALAAYRALVAADRDSAIGHLAIARLLANRVDYAGARTALVEARRSAGDDARLSARIAALDAHVGERERREIERRAAIAVRAREEALRQAMNSGIFGALSRSRGSLDALWGDRIGDTFGTGGLGLSGLGSADSLGGGLGTGGLGTRGGGWGGGGTGEGTIGLGNFGTIGRSGGGSGFGYGSGYGRGSGGIGTARSRTATAPPGTAAAPSATAAPAPAAPAPASPSPSSSPAAPTTTPDEPAGAAP